MNTRIKKLRKALDLTQREFAERIGSTANILTNYEKGRRNPSNSVVNNICKEFNVNEEWLRNGTGEMFCIAACDALDALAQQFRLSHGDYILIEKFILMKQESRQVIIDFVTEVSAALSADPYDSPDTMSFSAAIDYESEKAAFIAIASDSFDKEKNQASKTSSANESDAG